MKKYTDKLLLKFAMWWTKKSQEYLAEKFFWMYFQKRNSVKAYYLTVFKD